METIDQLKGRVRALKRDYLRFIFQDGSPARLRLEMTQKQQRTLFEKLRTDVADEIGCLRAEKAAARESA